MSAFFDMGGYGAYIWPVVGLSLVGVIALYAQSVKSHKALEDKEDTQ